MKTGMAPRHGVHFHAEEGVSQQPKIERQPDYGNVIHVACRHCGELNLLDPTRMHTYEAGVLLLCQHCGDRFPVRDFDRHRPDPGWVASLYTAALPPTDTDTEAEPPPSRKRLLRRS
jgi:hypothetical protein